MREIRHITHSVPTVTTLVCDHCQTDMLKQKLTRYFAVRFRDENDREVRIDLCDPVCQFAHIREFIERGGASRDYNFWIADVDISKTKK